MARLDSDLFGAEAKSGSSRVEARRQHPPIITWTALNTVSRCGRVSGIPVGEHKLELGRLTSAVHSSSVEGGLLAQLANQLIRPPGHCQR